MAGGHIDPRAAEILGACLILFTIFFEIGLHKLEKWLAKKHRTVQVFVRLLYRELMTLGLVSIIFVLVEFIWKPDPEISSSFHFAHLVIFFLAFFFILVSALASYTSIMLGKRWHKHEQIDFVNYIKEKKEFTVLHDRKHKRDSIIWQELLWFHCNPFTLLRYRRLHELMNFHDLRYQFIYYRGLPHDFLFSSYLRKVKSLVFIDIVQLHWTTWVVILFALLLDMIRRSFYTTSDYDSIMVITLASGNLCLSVVLGLKIRHISYKLTRNPALYFEDVTEEDARKLASGDMEEAKRSLERGRASASGYKDDLEYSGGRHPAVDLSNQNYLMHLINYPSKDSNTTDSVTVPMPPVSTVETQAGKGTSSETEAKQPVNVNAGNDAVQRREETIIAETRTEPEAEQRTNIASTSRDEMMTMETASEEILHPNFRTENVAAPPSRDITDVKTQVVNTTARSTSDDHMHIQASTISDRGAQYQKKVNMEQKNQLPMPRESTKERHDVTQEELDAFRIKAQGWSGDLNQKHYGRGIFTSLFQEHGTKRHSLDVQNIERKDLMRKSLERPSLERHNFVRQSADYTSTRHSMDGHVQRRSLDMGVARISLDPRFKPSSPKGQRYSTEISARYRSESSGQYSVEYEQMWEKKENLGMKHMVPYSELEQREKPENLGYTQSVSDLEGKARPSRGSINSTIYEKYEDTKQSAFRRPKKQYPGWVIRVIPRLGRVPPEAEKLFWFGSKALFLWLVQFNLFSSVFLSSIDLANTVETSAKYYSLVDWAAVWVSSFSLLFILLRTSFTLKTYIFAINAASLVNERVAEELVHQVVERASMDYATVPGRDSYDHVYGSRREDSIDFMDTDMAKDNRSRLMRVQTEANLEQEDIEMARAASLREDSKHELSSLSI